MAYVTCAKSHTGIKKHLRGWESKVGPDGYMTLDGYTRNTNGPTLADLKIIYPRLKRRFEYVF